jgi:N-acetylmuramoyl-L-alanine amidase
MRRGFLIVVGVVAAFFLLPLPRGWDPRLEEVPDARYGELARFDRARTRAEVEAALAIVDPERRLRPYLTLDDQHLEVRLQPGDRSPVVQVRLGGAAAAAAAAEPWRRVALDPGHFGGAWSKLEKRHHGSAGGPPVREGDLAWGTAALVARELRAEGKEVRVVRPPPPVAPFPAGVDPGFDAGREAGYKLAELQPRRSWWVTPWTALRLWRARRQLARDTAFELYTRYELRRRAAAAAAFGADLTLSLHWDFTGSNSNGVLVFSPGNALADELATSSQRFWALRRVLDGTLPRAARLASAMGASLMRRLDLPALTASHDVESGRFWRPLDPARGVYARDLAILRRTPGVVLLLEGPCVNETAELRRLQRTDLSVDGQRYPARIRAYADAVLDGLRAP